MITLAPLCTHDACHPPDGAPKSHLEGGGYAKSKNYKLKHTLQDGVNVRMNIKSEREGKTNQLRK